MGEKFVLMFHPEIEDSQSAVGVRAFEKVWKDRGWELVDADSINITLNASDEEE